MENNLLNRHRWKRSLIELNGSFEPNYQHCMSGLIMQSYSQVDFSSPLHPVYSVRPYVSSLEFDSKGVYLASATTPGCLTVHNFDSIRRADREEDEAKQLLHMDIGERLDVARWNLANQDEVACTSLESSAVRIFDVRHVSSEPVCVLRKRRPKLTIYENLYDDEGFSDIAFPFNDKSRLLASDINGIINVWDRRASNLSCFEFTTKPASSLNSIKLSRDGENVFGASMEGTIYVWDMRGGRSSTAFSNHNEEYCYPLSEVKLPDELAKIKCLKDQTRIFPTNIHSIDIDPSCPYQLAFHLEGGWSGVLNINKLQLTHLHRPLPPSYKPNHWVDPLCLRKACWLPINSIYVVGSPCSSGLYLLDFYPNCTSACHVDNDSEDISNHEATNKRLRNRYLQTSEVVHACAAHPLNGTIVAGTPIASLLVISN